jgi:hypothetical protein
VVIGQDRFGATASVAVFVIELAGGQRRIWCDFDRALIVFLGRADSAQAPELPKLVRVTS